MVHCVRRHHRKAAAARTTRASSGLLSGCWQGVSQVAIEETQRRRERQLAYNAEHDITPESIRKAIRRGIEEDVEARQLVRRTSGSASEEEFTSQELITELEAEMLTAAEELEFERAAELRDRIQGIQQGQTQTDPKESVSRSRRGRRTRGRRVPKPERP